MSSDDYREWPVLMEYTEERLVWVSARSHAEAISYANNNSDVYQSGDSFDGGISARAFYDWEHADYFGEHSDRVEMLGPAPLCTVCGLHSHGRAEMSHDYMCPAQRANRVAPVNPLRVPERTAAVAELLTTLTAGREARVDLDGYRLTLTVTPQTRAEWGAWLRLLNIRPDTVRTLATYAHGLGRVGAKQLDDVDVTLVGLGVPQLPEAVTA